MVTLMNLARCPHIEHMVQSYSTHNFLVPFLITSLDIYYTNTSVGVRLGLHYDLHTNPSEDKLLLQQKNPTPLACKICQTSNASSRKTLIHFEVPNASLDKEHNNACVL